METVVHKQPRLKKIKWITYTFGAENNPTLEKFDINPVTDIPIRLAVEQGYIKNKRDLELYQLTDEWNGHPKRSIVIAGKMEEGREFAVWIADDKEHDIPRVKTPRETSNDGEASVGTDEHPSLLDREDFMGVCDVTPDESCYEFAFFTPPDPINRIHLRHRIMPSFSPRGLSFRSPTLSFSPRKLRF
jgi:hypothetical protein